jgi:AcrR family transcriptional regulator
MNISPGNLYYHFKGKEPVVQELYARFHANLLVALEQFVKQGSTDGKVLLTYLCLLSDIMLQYRFISQDTVGIAERYPALRTQLTKLLTLLYKSILRWVKLLPTNPASESFPHAAEVLTDNLLSSLLNYKAYENLIDIESDDKSAEQVIRGIEPHLYLQLLPFL